jgi:hypothetical protein
MLPPTCRATPAFGSGQPAGTEINFCKCFIMAWSHYLFFQLLVPITIGKQHNFVLGLARACADKIQLRSKNVSRSAGWSLKEVDLPNLLLRSA